MPTAELLHEILVRCTVPRANRQDRASRSAPRTGASLLQTLQSLLERTYRMETGVAEIGRYVIGDEGYRLLYPPSRTEKGDGVRLDGPGALRLHARAPTRTFSGIWPVGTAGILPTAGLERESPAESPARAGTLAGKAPRTPEQVGSASGGARVLVRDGPGPIAARIYYPDELIRNLEARPPLQGLGDENIDDFATFVEELDHFLLIAERARLRKPVSLLELELHANVTKFLVCALFLAARGGRGGKVPLEAGARVWLLWHLFEKATFSEPDPQVLLRYRDASRFARRFIDRLEREPGPRARLARLRAFHDASHQQKLTSLS